MRHVSRAVFFWTLAFAAFLGGCSHANFTPQTTPTATPSASGSGVPTATPTPSSSSTPVANCGTAAPGAIYIAMGSYIEPPDTPDPTYGSVYGYSLVDTNGNYPLQSSPIVLKPNDTIQFTNVDPPTASDANGTSHSAAGLQTNAFPIPHTFPSAAFAPGRHDAECFDGVVDRRNRLRGGSSLLFANVRRSGVRNVLLRRFRFLQFSQHARRHRRLVECRAISHALLCDGSRPLHSAWHATIITSHSR